MAGDVWCHRCKTACGTPSRGLMLTWFSISSYLCMYLSRLDLRICLLCPFSCICECEIFLFTSLNFMNFFVFLALAYLYLLFLFFRFWIKLSMNFLLSILWLRADHCVSFLATPLPRFAIVLLIVSYDFWEILSYNWLLHPHEVYMSTETRIK